MVQVRAEVAGNAVEQADPTSHSDLAFVMMAASSCGSMKPVGSLNSFVLPTGHEGHRRLHDPRTSMLKKNRVTLR